MSSPGAMLACSRPDAHPRYTLGGVTRNVPAGDGPRRIAANPRRMPHDKRTSSTRMSTHSPRRIGRDLIHEAPPRFTRFCIEVSALPGIADTVRRRKAGPAVRRQPLSRRLPFAWAEVLTKNRRRVRPTRRCVQHSEPGPAGATCSRAARAAPQDHARRRARTHCCPHGAARRPGSPHRIARQAVASPPRPRASPSSPT